MSFKVGQVVFSKAGRDKGKPLIVLEEKDDFVLVVDGKERPLSRPKKKNPKHLVRTNTVIEEGSMATDSKIRKALKQFFMED